MKSDKKQLESVATILMNWKGSDAADEASPSDVAAQIDRAYTDYLASLPEQTIRIRQGRKAWERKVA